jgi:hypothetical protein
VEIRKSEIERYFDYVIAYIADEGGEPDNLTDYHDYIINMKKLAAYKDELDLLLSGIDYYLLNPSLYTPTFTSVHYIFDADEMEELLQYIRSVAFPDAPPLNPETIKDVKIVDVKTTV